MQNKHPASAAASPVEATPPRARRPAIGAQVRRLRRGRSLTLAQVAGRSGLNVGFLSQIENDKASPSLETLAALGEAIGVPITWFLLDTSPPPRVVRAREQRRRRVPGGSVALDVDGGAGRDLRIVRVTIGPGQQTGLHAHAGDEHHLLLSGRMRAVQGDHVIDLGPGDYLLWDASVPHDVATVGEEPADVLLISHTAHGEAPPAHG
ncbi:MAG: helix-turn-helix domain-containing protein [Candidatus Limnocylindrales bacterium]